ncbi:MAG: tRNA (N6-isopentenyl adenosine(37)-C2)-methylthiotransferase MiaB [Bacteroidales bacterium]|jgi:tRNA-2-methylthio-N6-dimethylallyladenosine synthase|nr:tRNA (N6-isopentenyl adenosine(37)-C2)-methylthiotransferase MiaB [Bacteroidales bacterium]
MRKKVYIETYGCQMNQSDSEIVGAIVEENGLEVIEDINQADIIFVNTCSIRDNAEQRVKNRLGEFEAIKKKKPELRIGVLGCMAERMKEELFKENKSVDIIVGPDSYRDIPKLLNLAESGQKAANVILSEEETYSEITPVRLSSNGVSAFISIMRGCENFCSYCVVPYTRGKERSRDYNSIIKEAEDLFSKGYKEITLLGQNVNSYLWENENEKINFAKLIEMVAKVSPLLRIRFSTSHPKDISEELIDVIARNNNICKSLHLPVQSGSSRMLKKMNRKYTREDYIGKIDMIKSKIPDISLSTDIIAGFCSETIEDHNDTLSIMEYANYDYAFMFNYSQRPNTLAEKKYEDDVPSEEKTKRLNEIIDLQRKLSLASNKRDIGKEFEILVEGVSKRSKEKLFGRTSQNKVVIFDNKGVSIGNYVNVKIVDCTSATLIGQLTDKKK